MRRWPHLSRRFLHPILAIVGCRGKPQGRSRDNAWLFDVHQAACASMTL
jgi:hypothetical protein